MNTKYQDFDPNDVGLKGALFGLPHTVEEAGCVMIPVPWEVTVSYQEGTASAPQAILEASSQLDLYLNDIADSWKWGIHLLPVQDDWIEQNDELRRWAKSYIEWLEEGKPHDKEDLQKIPTIVNKASEKLNQWVKEESLKWLKKDKIVGVLGGEHSVPLGLIQALAELHDNIGILQIDAHADLRNAYEGFEYSHASIMYNALKNKKIRKLVQVGLRDICEAEANIIKQSQGRIEAFYDYQLKERQYQGVQWHDICQEIIVDLPQTVYISFDIDGLDPKYCPNTGTPVPGGLNFEQALYLIKMLVRSGRKIVGFDLCEVAPGTNEWDANVGARVLYRMAALAGVSQNRLSWNNL